MQFFLFTRSHIDSTCPMKSINRASHVIAGLQTFAGHRRKSRSIRLLIYIHTTVMKRERERENEKPPIFRKLGTRKVSCRYVLVRIVIAISISIASPKTQREKWVGYAPHAFFQSQESHHKIQPPRMPRLDSISQPELEAVLPFPCGVLWVLMHHVKKPHTHTYIIYNSFHH